MNLIFHNETKAKKMKHSISLFLLTLFSFISSPELIARSSNSYIEKKIDFECLYTEKNCLDGKEREIFNKKEV